MITATLTSKGQITIPKAVRQSLHLQAGDLISFALHGDHEAVLRPVTKSVDDVFGMLHKKGMKALTVEDMDAAIAKRHGSKS